MIRIESERIKKQVQYYSDLTRSNWSPIIQPSDTGDEYWDKLFNYFPDHQLFYETVEGEWLGFANTIPIKYDGLLNDLPEEGWDWLIEQGIVGYEKGITPNTLGGLQIGVNPKFRGKGWSKVILEKAKMSMQDHGYKQFILPIRPTLKDQHPEIPMEDYMSWTTDGKIYDPWIRTHLNAGARIVKVCHRAMTVEGTIREWESWAEEKFHHSGKYAVKGGLSMVDINLERDKGLYLEPNIWIQYS